MSRRNILKRVQINSGYDTPPNWCKLTLLTFTIIGDNTRFLAEIPDYQKGG